jgi:hypothetical protein
MAVVTACCRACPSLRACVELRELGLLDVDLRAQVRACLRSPTACLKRSSPARPARRLRLAGRLLPLPRHLFLLRLQALDQLLLLVDGSLLLFDLAAARR